MEVRLAPRYAGFCGGVKRAWRLAQEEAVGAAGHVYLSGKLIHNDPAMHELAEQGVVVGAPEQIAPGSTIIVRAHGEGPRFYERAEKAGLRVVDATCSIVKAVQRRARSLEEQGYRVVLFGHRTHPEAMATVAYTERGVIVESVEEARALPREGKIAAIAQTTAPQWEYERVCEALRERCDELADQGRICGWTLSAQQEAEELSQQVDAMVVIGGRESSNTQRLVDVCLRHCPTYYVETADELVSGWFDGASSVGITAGASTRDSDIDAVVAWLRAR
jgi:(E)-4-hydroxy-3-methyl-but-2-enyl pyrophosphate reductase